MRITRENLIKLAQETVAQRSRASRGIISAYATGSLLLPDPLLGGVTDIDLVFIHDSEPGEDREIVRLSPDIHLDIAHHNQNLYRHPRHLRLDPWLGYILYENPILLHDTQHWFEFIQASVRSQFWQPGNVIQRARPLVENARQIWIDLQSDGSHHLEKFDRYLESLNMAANSISCLTGSPLAERRFLIQFLDRARAIHNPGLVAGLAGLLGSAEVEVETVRGWLLAWRDAYQKASASTDAPPRLHPLRLAYYEKGIEALLSGETPQAALWPLLSTWNRAIKLLTGETETSAAWSGVLASLKMDEPGFPDRLEGLDAYLDSVEESIETWANENGA